MTHRDALVEKHIKNTREYFEKCYMLALTQYFGESLNTLDMIECRLEVSPQYRRLFHGDKMLCEIITPEPLVVENVLNYNYTYRVTV